MLPLFIYRSLKFKKLEHLSEIQYLNIKKFGLDKSSSLPPIKEYNKWTIVFMALGTFILFILNFVSSYYYEVVQGIGVLILFYMIPKFIIETYNYNKYKKDELEFKRTLVDLAKYTRNYGEFKREYKEEILTSDFGKFLIRKFISAKK